ncbi:hypothetical protein N7532_002500 [Penicillium argentinense]|uniref:Beta-galactosidase n=1 Tax=Penicillium argentinense TaxID=1131581 RepID=A0A9W9G0H3_9EURO|nr:uncharacterized protein N7532_002500 [Penicillium argentinense]KAJ5109855.1 hypothetical protein N7532_002500 [Penicillium argentinense]
MLLQEALLVITLCLSTALATGPFSYTNTTFLHNNNPIQLLGGQMDPQRIPYQLWSDRLSKARAMGLNTIFSYIYWDQLSPTPGTWSNTGNNDIARFFKIAQDHGLNLVLRPGPYICGEHEWGGFPAWLAEIPDLIVRTNNGPFLNATRSYFQNLATDLRPLLVTNGGPILMIQVENEYGSYGSNHAYTSSLRDMLSSTFGEDITLYTNDGGTSSMLKGGQVFGVLAESDGDPKTAFAARNKYITDKSSLGPQLDGEYYVTWLDQWASNKSHQSDDGDRKSIDKVKSDLSWILDQNASFNIYMVHGGTNWGFQNGADWGDSLEPITTSYDYGAPIDEGGRVNGVYHAIREILCEEPVVEIPEIGMRFVGGLFDALPEPVVKERPVNMEALGQSVGFTLYRHVAKKDSQGMVKPGDVPRDRVLVYVNGRRVGVIDSLYVTPNKVNIDLKKGDTLDMLIENMGRVNYGPRIVDQRKGVVGDISVSGEVLFDWEIYSLPLSSPLSSSSAKTSAIRKLSNISSPAFFSGTFNMTTIGDTFLELPGWTKGVVWVNGVNLGRYWVIGPQQTLYLPGCYLRQGGE